MLINKLLILLIGFWLFPTSSFGQQFVLTKLGLRSSVDTTSNFVHYKSLNKNKKELYEFCENKVEYSIDFFPFKKELQPQFDQITIEGKLEHNSFLVFGKSQILFLIKFNFEETGIKVVPELLKTNGKQLNFNLLFKKDGTARISSIKNTIEQEINDIIQKVIQEVVEYQK